MAPRVAICGIHIESSTFTPHMTTAADFTVLRADDLLQRYPWITHSPIPGAEHAEAVGEDLSIPLVREWSEAVEWVPVLHCGALPGGPVEPTAYSAWREEIVDGLREAGHLDGILFDIHGAMSVPGVDDAEGDLIRAIREVVGPEVMVSASMDLHGNVSRALFENCDLLTCYRMAPHEDAWICRERAARNLCELLISDSPKPHKALVHVPVLLPGEMTSTRIEPAKSLYGRIPEVEQRQGILDAAIWIGFAWADEPRNKAAIVVTGTDAHAVEEAALELGREFWKVHSDFVFVAPTDSYPSALDAAIASDKRPFLLSDSGDNPGAGGADDVTVTLAELLGRPEIQDGPVTALLASIVDPAAVAACAEVGVNGHVDIEVGGHLDSREPGPQRVVGVVENLVDDPRGGLTAVVRSGGLTVIVTTKRNQYTTNEQFHRLGMDPRDFDVVTVKIGYLEPDIFDLAADWILTLTPGGVDQDLVRLGHRRIDRPMYPFDPDMADPQLIIVTG
ncbi:M81 family metallopeptidase [Cutibacterium equinum]|uniref:M81 family metallopeptidase n=1 Tax=Cutibacterium equinum TaxID=3016342 RepID=A0ABY7QY45_9ACTN|nr:M81 family metallopeptidase [Cutibacterium equinum]WCC79963.1 M81 family metallopeptidase [Cutibacterium equinum]